MFRWGFVNKESRLLFLSNLKLIFNGRLNFNGWLNFNVQDVENEPPVKKENPPCLTDIMSRNKKFFMYTNITFLKQEISEFSTTKKLTFLIIADNFFCLLDGSPLSKQNKLIYPIHLQKLLRRALLVVKTLYYYSIPPLSWISWLGTPFNQLRGQNTGGENFHL